MDAATRESIRHTLALYGVPEAKEVLARLDAGMVNGSVFLVNGCGCLIGSLHAARTQEDTAPPLAILDRGGFPYGSVLYAGTLLAQAFFLGIRPGHTPWNSLPAREASDVILEWVLEQEALAPVPITARRPFTVGDEATA